MNDRLSALADLPLRENLRGKAPYGAPQIEVPYALNVNENTHPLPATVASSILQRVQGVLSGINRYPDRDASQLRQALADYLTSYTHKNPGPALATPEEETGLSAQNLWAANGSNEILQQILQAFAGPGRTLLSFAPTYSMYPILAAGLDTEYIAGTRAEDYTLSAEHAVAQMREHRPSVVFLASPNNPTATALEPEVIEAVYQAGEESQSVVVVDEAYAEFARDRSRTALNLLPGRPRLIITRTMSKAFGLAGARLGYMAAAPEVIDAMQLVRLPYHLSAVTQAVALGALEHIQELLSTVDSIRQQRDRIAETLKDLGFAVSSSDANFVFFSGVREPQALFTALLEKGILIRDVGIPHSLRVTAGTVEETDAFLAAMEKLAPEHLLSQEK